MANSRILTGVCAVVFAVCAVSALSINAVAWEAYITFSHPHTTYEDTSYSFGSSVKNTGPDSESQFPEIDRSERRAWLRLMVS
jgi:hypothetical protein